MKTAPREQSRLVNAIKIGNAPPTGQTFSQMNAPQKSREVTGLFDALADIIDKKVIGQWLQRPNQQFDGTTPLQVMERGETDRLWRMIWQIREGHSG
jgi:hypothetical protein